MKQLSFTDIEYAGRRRAARRETFLGIMDGLIRWDYWVGEIRPHYPSGQRGRRPRGIETMLRMYLLQKWYGLSDEGIEDAVSDSYAMRSFMRLDFSVEQVPAASTLGRFRHILKETGIAQRLQEEIEEKVRASGKQIRYGRITDAALITAQTRKKEKEKA
jgi:IS5 family transposase